MRHGVAFFSDKTKKFVKNLFLNKNSLFEKLTFLSVKCYNTVMFFYDHFDESQIAGVFTPTHFIVLAIYFILMAVALFFSRKMTEPTVKKFTLAAAILTCSMEVVKISLRIAKGQNPGEWLPLYVSSLFLYASWMSLSKVKVIQTTGVTFLSFGSTTAGIVYAFYPSTSLLRYPIWHPGSIHGLSYHWIILYIGILTLWKRFRPKAVYFWHFFLFMTAFTIPAFICNELYGYNLMFIGVPFYLPPLQFLYDTSPYLYAAVVYLAQSVALYWAWFGGYQLVMHLMKKRRAAREGELSDDSAT